MVKFKNEEELAVKLIEWLEKEGWEVFKEVEYWYGRADIIAKRDNILWGIECKCTLNDGVLDQADNLKNFVHLVSVAVPVPKSWKYTLSNVKRTFLDNNGIGLLHVDPASCTYSSPIRVRIDSKYQRTFGKFYRDANNRKEFLERIDQMRGGLTKYHKLITASAQHGKYITTFTETNIKMVEYVLKHGPTKLSEIVRDIDHHYSNDISARNGLGRGINWGYIKGLEYKNSLVCVKCGIIQVADILKEKGE